MAGEFAFLAQPDHPQQSIDPLQRGVDPVEIGEELDQLGRGQIVEEGGRLQLHADSAADVLGLGAGVITGHHDRAGVRRAQPFDHLQRGRLAGAVRTQNPEDLAGKNGQVDPIDRGQRPIALDQPAGFDDRLTGGNHGRL